MIVFKHLREFLIVWPSIRNCMVAGAGVRENMDRGDDWGAVGGVAQILGTHHFFTPGRREHALAESTPVRSDRSGT